MRLAMLNHDHKYTEHYILSNAMCDLDVRVLPGTDLDTQFPALDVDTDEIIRVNGWHFIAERIND